MLILLVEQANDSLQSFKFLLESATTWRVEHTSSVADAIERLPALITELKIVVVTIGREPDVAHKFIKFMREKADELGYEWPRVLVLSLVTQDAHVADSFDKVQAEFLLRRFPDQIIETVKKLKWQARKPKSLPVIVIRRREGHVLSLLLRDGKTLREMRAGPRLRTLAEYLGKHRRTEHTTTMIADALEICQQSVKQYMKRLRLAFDETRRNTGISVGGDSVFWTEKRPGGYVHGLHAHVEFEDHAYYDGI